MEEGINTYFSGFCAGTSAVQHIHKKIWKCWNSGWRKLVGDNTFISLARLQAVSSLRPKLRKRIKCVIK